MVNSCSAYNCTQKWEKGMTFHQFPEDKNLLKLWLYAMRRKYWKPTKYSKICSKHFTPDSYGQSGWSSRKTLKDGAVPTIFSFSEHLQKKQKSRHPPHLRKPLDDKNVASQTEAENGENSLEKDVIDGMHEWGKMGVGEADRSFSF